MNIHRKIITLVGIGILLLLAILAISVNSVMDSVAVIIAGEDIRSREMQGIESIVHELGNLSTNSRHYLTNNKELYRQAYHASRDTVRGMLDTIENQGRYPQDRQLAVAIRVAVQRLDERATQLFTLTKPVGRDRMRAYELTIEMDGLIADSEQRIRRHVREERAEQLKNRTSHLRALKKRILILSLLTLLLSIVFLLGFGVYVRRKVALPLNGLWKSVKRPGEDALDHPMRDEGAGDIMLLTKQLKEMVQELKRSHAELEQKLLDRTNDLAAIDSVALTLSQTGNLRDMLTKSLGRILNSLPDLEMKGGIFLCDQNGETLSLVAHQGLPEEFVRQERTIRMGECLCGIAAQTGEIMFTEHGCNDPRHTRGRFTDSHAHAIIPVKSRGIVLGVIVLYPRMGFQLKPAELQMLDTIGAQLGLAVENLELYAEVKESSLKYWDLFENARDILFTMDGEGKLAAVNKAMVRFTGYAKVDLVGKSIFDFLTPAGAQIARKMLAGQGSPGRRMEFEIIRKDDKLASIEVSVRRLPKDHAPAGFHVSVRDVTEQKAIREKLMQAERLVAMGQLGVAVRHEINNPLSTIIGNVELLIERSEETGQDKELTTRLEAVLTNALRIADIVKRLQEIKQDKVVEYRKGIQMTDLK